MKIRNLSLNILVSLLLLQLPNSLAAQKKIELGVGIKLRYFMAFKEGKSNFTASLALGISKHFEPEKEDYRYFSPTYQVAFNIYANGLGTNMLETQKKTQFDIVNSFSATYGHRSSKHYIYEFKTFNNMTASAFQSNYGVASLSVSTNFIINNHKRNQHVGFAGVSLGPIRVGTYNDKFLPLFSDHYDRWWTGGFFIQSGVETIKLNEEDNIPNFFNKNRINFSYERFTGNVQDAFNLVSRLSLNYVPAKNKEANFNNRSQYMFSWRFANKMETSVSILGHIKNEFQDKNHEKSGKSKHVSYSGNFLLIGIHYSPSLFHEKVLLP